MVVWIGHVRSWHNMGVAAAWCLRGCACAPIAVDGHHDAATTQQFMAKLYVSQAERCEIGLRVLPDTHSGRHKFVVRSVAVSKFMAKVGHGDFTDSLLMGVMTGPEEEEGASKKP